MQAVGQSSAALLRLTKGWERAVAVRQARAMLMAIVAAAGRTQASSMASLLVDQVL
jgi:hypothetical protein